MICSSCGKKESIVDSCDSYLCECGIFYNITKKGFEKMEKLKLRKMS